MCNIKDAIRHVKLANTLLEENKIREARINYLEAVSIYLLQAELQKKDEFVDIANEYYKKSQEIIGKTVLQKLTKKQLARICLTEKKQGEEEMCEEKSVTTLVKFGKDLEKKDPQKAANNYLKAAEMLLEQSENNPAREEECIALANKLYVKAKELKKTKVQILTSKNNLIKFDDIGGLDSLKEDIHFKIIEPLENPELFKHYKKSIGGGILVYGPPGCGKSLIARATANEVKSTFIHVKCSDLKSKYVGETEQNIAELFNTAREKQPCIIFFDEFEALGGDRTSGQPHEKSAVAQLLTEIDGMDSKDQQILLLAATNEPWSIDSALRREGRFGKTIYIPRPDFNARKQIIRIEMTNRPIDELELNKLGELTEGLSGADIKAVCEAATDIPLRESMITKKRRKINMKDMLAGIDSTQSVMTQWFQKAREQIVMHNLEDSFKEIMDDINETVKEKIIA